MFRSLEPLILASGSPRRREMLEAMGLKFDVIPSEVEESGGEGQKPDELAQRWAREKAESVSGAHPDRWVLGADTIVVLGKRIFGKPKDLAEAVSVLKDLSGKTHEVITGMCLVHAGKSFLRVGSVCTKVTFKDLREVEILAYVNTGEPLDKAGGYGIQGAAAYMVRSLEGSYTNVVGLPLCEALEWLFDRGVIAPAV
jgi:septum formation protein